MLGTVDSIANLPVEKMRAYFERRYSPTNITLVAAGKHKTRADAMTALLAQPKGGN